MIVQDLLGSRVLTKIENALVIYEKVLIRDVLMSGHFCIEGNKKVEEYIKVITENDNESIQVVASYKVGVEYASINEIITNLETNKAWNLEKVAL
ncbi:hypothetical protein [Halalkalibacter alkaliphilus]|uniref:Uncharacterized protein n=1 Tax=Halalkalibacter alkaliphilus TaxID=2917993 RepID=A0A9X2A2K1_9BACI|nr:hypothetical protein [Halalkalibacter alkaliphilus]MCL7745592.1 hypothetical protein [Halalkalibacter alkaliphilus]